MNKHEKANTILNEALEKATAVLEKVTANDSVLIDEVIGGLKKAHEEAKRIVDGE